MYKIFQIYMILILTLFCNPVQAEVRNIQDNYKLIYTILESDGTPVTSQEVTVKIQRASNNQWLDFDDLAFKASGWGNKTITLSEDTDEDFYYYIFNPPAGETTAEQYAFLIENSNATYKDHQIELVNYQVIGSGSAPNVYEILAEIDANSTKLTNINTTVTAFNGTWDSTKAGYLDIAVSSRLPTANITLTNGNVSVGTNYDKAGYNLVVADYQNISNITWANATRTLTAGTNIALAKGTGITGFNDIAAADVWAIATRQLTGTQVFNLTGNITGSLSGSVGSLTTWDKANYTLSAAGIDSIWDEVQTGHTTAASFGLYIDSKVSEAGGGGLTVQDIVDGVWDEVLANHTTTNTTGKKLSEMPTLYDVGP